MRPEAVLFDCDGVLVDSEPVTDRVIIENLSSYGLTLTPDEVTEMFLGGTLPQVGEKARAMGADLPETWTDEIYRKIDDSLRGNCPAVDGVHTLLDRLDRAGIPYGVASNGPRHKMAVTLGQNDLLDRMGDRIFSAHDGIAPKPAPDMYLMLAERLGVAPGRAVVVEDSAAGVRAAKAAGIRVIGYAERTPAEKLAALGAEAAATMAEVGRLMGFRDD
ncbi:MAG: HAD family phosphatase [Pseudomonadota bacterium]